MATTNTHTDAWDGEAYSRKEITERLEHWRELLLERKAGVTQVPFEEIRRNLDVWLDEFLLLKG